MEAQELRLVRHELIVGEGQVGLVMERERTNVLIHEGASESSWITSGIKSSPLPPHRENKDENI
jgi:hypothetical protein